MSEFSSHLSILFKYILCDYLDHNDRVSILMVSKIEEFDIANLLGVDINYNNCCALRYASDTANLPIIQYILENSAYIYEASVNALRQASENGHLHIVKYLVEKGSDIRTVIDSLKLASQHGHLSIVKCLVEEGGADIHARAEDALMSASQCGHLPIVKYLFSKGAVIHAYDAEALRLAVQNKHFHVVRYILANS